jgi:tetratricopeptide (TPR) repeat protein
LVQQRLSTAIFRALALAAVVLAGCATQYPPSPGPSAEPEQPAEEPSPAPDAQQDEPARPARDARAPTLALLRQSERSADDGDLEGAIAYVERAIRLNSRDASLWLRLARLQLAAERPSTAEQLAHKAIALAGARGEEQRQGWLLVADALEAQGDDEAAARIRARWRTFRG